MTTDSALWLFNIYIVYTLFGKVASNHVVLPFLIFICVNSVRFSDFDLSSERSLLPCTSFLLCFSFFDECYIHYFQISAEVGAGSSIRCTHYV